MKHNRYIRLYEGKKQAKEILLKGMIEPHLFNSLFNIFEKHDPTSPKNKYFEMYAKLVVVFFHNKSLRLAMKDVGVYFNDWADKNNIKNMIDSIELRNQKINLSKINDPDNFIKTLQDVSSKITKSFAKKGITGLKKDTDYIEIPLSDDRFQSYIPLHYNASKVLASNKVGRCEGKWCTAYQKTDEFWVSYIEDKGGILVYTVNNDPSADSEDLKQAIFFYPDNGQYEAFDANDSSTRVLFEGINIEKFVRSNWDKIRDNMSVPPIEDKVIPWLEGQTYDEKNIKVDNGVVIIKTKGFMEYSFIAKVLNPVVYESVCGDLWDNFYYDNYTNRTTKEIIEFYQDNVKSKHASNEVKGPFPDLYEVDYNDPREVKEWEGAQDNDIEDLNIMINRAEESAWYDEVYRIVKKNAIGQLEEVFKVNEINFEEIILTVALSDIVALSPREYISEGEDLTTLLKQQTDIFRNVSDDRAISYAYGDPTDRIEEMIVDYGFDMS